MSIAHSTKKGRTNKDKVLSKRRLNSSGSSKTDSCYHAPNVWIVRTSFLAFLGIVAAALGYLTFAVLHDPEWQLAETQFQSIADRALDSAHDITIRKRLATVTMASIVSTEYPNTYQWPNAAVRGFERVSNNIIDLSSSARSSLMFAPIVQPEQLEAFEDFAYDYFEKKFPSDPNVGMSSFGKGVYGSDRTGTVKVNAEDNRWRETDGIPRLFNSTKKYLAPIFQHNRGGSSHTIMMNLRHSSAIGPLLDKIVDCPRTNLIAEGQMGLDELKERGQIRGCGEITDMRVHGFQPSAQIISPIYPANEPSVLSGFIVSTITWAEALQNVFSSEVHGVDCVLETETQSYTYNITAGEASIKGEGDLHDRRYTSYGKKVVLTGARGSFFSNSSVSYTLTLYPNDDLFEVYSTRNPYIAAGVVCITVVFTSILFSIYDFVVKKQFYDNQRILDAKRQFVRFISHEVRTPLNAACMGIQLMQEEVRDILCCGDGIPKMKRSNSLLQTAAYGESAAAQQQKQLDSDCNLIKDVTIAFQSPVDVICENLEILLQDVARNTGSAIEILNDVLHYDKIEMGTMKLELTVVPIMDLIVDTANEFKLSAASKNINFSLDFSKLMNPFGDESSLYNVGGGVDLDIETASTFSKVEELPLHARNKCIIGDKIRVAEVIRNLLSNSLKFTPEEGNLTVSIEILKEEGLHGQARKKEKPLHHFILSDDTEISVQGSGYLKVTVVDTGTGMSQEQLANLFKAGVQFDKNNLQAGQGSGLGLYISKGIVEQHAGTLSAASEGIGHGTSFTMIIPLYKVPDNESIHDVTPSLCTTDTDIFTVLGKKEESIGPVVKECRRILVVDDSVTNRKLLMRLLEKRGHYCEQAKDGEKAVNKIAETMKSSETDCFDTILLDYEMPIMDGPTAAKQMRAFGCDSLIIGITGNVLLDDITHFKNCGANCVLPKPVKVDAIEDIWSKNPV